MTTTLPRHQDPRGDPVACSRPAAIEPYEKGLWRLVSFVGDPVAEFDAALALDPEFPMAHLARAGAHLMLAERAWLPAAKDSLAAAAALLPRAGPREHRHHAAASLAAAGRWSDARVAWEALLVEHPRDLLALFCAHMTDFYCGDCANLRLRVARVLPRWDPSVPGWSYVLGMHAFGLEECHQYDAAEAAGREALALQPRDPWSVHAVAHVMEMQGRHEEGADWLREREPDWAPDNGLAYHNWWHLALFLLEDLDPEGALAVYDERIAAQPGQLALQRVDQTALLSRLALLGCDPGPRWEAVADGWEASLEAEAGFYAFNDAHAAIAFIATGRDGPLAKLRAAMQAQAKRDGRSAGDLPAMQREAGLPLVDALVDRRDGRHRKAAWELFLLRERAVRFGGSHAQRDLITQTMFACAVDSGDSALASHMVQERLAAKAHTPLTRHWMAAARAAVPH
jgi:tetratricopeptide (TPR) repeat protein